MLEQAVQRNFADTLLSLGSLDIPLSDCLIVGSASAYGLGVQLPRNPNDVDVLLRNPEDFYRLAAKIPATGVTTNGYRGQTLRFTKGGTLTLEFTKQWPTDDPTEALFDRGISRDGMCYMSLADYLRALELSKRDKDLAVIPALKKELH